MTLATVKAMRAARARGLVTLSDLCQEFEISGTVARCDCVKQKSNREMVCTVGNVMATRFKKSALFCWATELA